MGWETRERGGRYYTRSRKVEGRVVREYVGTGLVAELVAGRDAAERWERVKSGATVRAERERLAPPDAALAAFEEAAEAMARIALVAHGYHQHHRGAWRKRRGT